MTGMNLSSRRETGMTEINFGGSGGRPDWGDVWQRRGRYDWGILCGSGDSGMTDWGDLMWQ